MSDELAVPKGDILAPFVGNRGAMGTSLDLTVTDNRHRMLKCLNDCNHRLAEEVNTVIVVNDVFVHMVDIPNKDTGEVNTVPRMVLIDSAGKTHECCSQTMVQSLQAISFAVGQPPWPAGLRLTVRSKQKNNRNIYWFDLEK